MDSLVRCFTWCLSDVNLWLSLEKYTINSPTYSMGDSLCKFCLQFNYDSQANRLEVLLCRCSDDGQNKVEIRFSLCLKTASGYVICSREFEVSFPMQGSEGIDTSQEALLEYLEKEHERDIIIVTCESILLEPTFKYLTVDIGDLSADLLKLRSGQYFPNAYLFAEGEHIPVHKEIVCSRSPVIKKKFEENNCWRDEHFPATVMQVMLDYLNSSRFSLKELQNAGIEQLYACASYYMISDLMKLLTPRRTYVTSLVNSKTETHTLQFPNFTNLCKSHYSVEHNRIKMQFNEDIEMSVRIIFEHYNECGKIILETSLRNLVNVKSLFVRLLILDQSNTPRTVEEIPLKIRDKNKLFRLEYGSESLFSDGNLILPYDILTLRYEIKFQFSGQLHISDPDIVDGSEGLLGNHEASMVLIRNMESLLESKFCADAFLVLPPTEIGGVPVSYQVHKWILSVRSPVFKDKFKAREQVFVDLDAKAAKAFLHYMYTGVLLATQPKNLEILHETAETFSVNSLKRACEAAVSKSTLDTKNIYSIYLIAIRGKVYELQKRCKDFIIKNKDLILGSYGWDKLRENNKLEWNEMRRYLND